MRNNNKFFGIFEPSRSTYCMVKLQLPNNNNIIRPSGETLHFALKKYITFVYQLTNAKKKQLLQRIYTNEKEEKRVKKKYREKRRTRFVFFFLFFV